MAELTYAEVRQALAERGVLYADCQGVAQDSARGEHVHFIYRSGRITMQPDWEPEAGRSYGECPKVFPVAVDLGRLMREAFGKSLTLILTTPHADTEFKYGVIAAWSPDIEDSVDAYADTPEEAACRAVLAALVAKEDTDG